MKINKKIFIILLFAICIVSLLFGSVAYYRFLVSGNINGSTGNAVFNVTGFKDDSSSIKTIELGKISPGDSGEFTITLDASGSTVDMYATLSIDRGDNSNNTELPTNLKFYTTPDHKSELHKYYSFLETTGTQKEELTIYWYWNPFISDEEDNKYINREFSANIKVSAVQISEYAMMKNGYYVGSTEFWNSTYKPYIRTITFGNDLSNKPESCTGNSDLCWDVSYSSSQKKKVYAYLVDSGLKDSTDSTKTLYNLYIVSEAPIFAPFDCRAIFYDFKNLISIKFNDNFNTSKVTAFYSRFGYYGMFEKCSAITTLDLSSFNTLNVTNMAQMFKDCTSLTNLDLSSFNTKNVITFVGNYVDDGMFYGCSSLVELNLSNFNTSNVTKMSGMFERCRSLKNLNLSSFDTSNVTSMYSMFYGCSKLTELDLSSFNTSNVTDMSNMFSNCSSITSLDLSNFNTSNVTRMGSMFDKCSFLTSLDLSNFNTSNVTNMSGMFLGCSSLTNLNLSSFDTSNVTTYGQSYTGMFSSCSKLATTINIMNENITSYNSMFSGAATANGAKITVNYIAALDTIAEGETQSLIDKIIATKSPNSNIVKGSQI